MTLKIMVFRQRGNYLRPVNTVKHVIDIQGGLVLAVQDNLTIVDGVDNPVLSSPAQVSVGSHVKSIFLNVQVAATSTAALANIYMMVFLNPSNALTLPAANTIGVSDLKKQVIHQEMIMTEKNTTAFPRTLFRGVIKIPRKAHRIGHDDTIIVSLLSPGVNYDYCIQCIYKEIR